MSLGWAMAGSAEPAHWSFLPLSDPPVPSGRASHPVDRFLDARRSAHGLGSGPVASPEAWLRRTHFVVTGLPPTPGDVASVHGGLDDAGRLRWIDRLLASPAYGERWARHWLDVVRFGESQGFEYDIIRDHAWRYRDYVVRALNGDTPYGRFVMEQVAGDVMEDATAETIAATGFLVAGPWDQAGNGSASPSLRAQVREAELEDIVGTVGQTFLGLTLNCARCHAHKFDPIPQADYYRVRAVFAGIFHGDRPLATPGEKARRAAMEERRVGRSRDISRRLSELDDLADARDPLVAQGWVAPLVRWSFRPGPAEVEGSLKAHVMGGATVRDGLLALDGKEAHVRSDPLGEELAEFTLEAWVALDDLDQRGGGVVSLESASGAEFDSIVFGELEPGHWMAGSEGFRRTRSLGAGAETSVGGWVHVALTRGPGGRTTLYRQGVPWGEGYVTTGAPAPRYGPDSRILVGRRHTGGGQAFLRGAVDEARVYGRALDAATVRRSFEAGPDAVLPAVEGRESRRTPAERSEREALMAELRQRWGPPPPVSDAMAYAATTRPPAATHVLGRGEPSRPGELVAPGAPGLLVGWPGDLRLKPDAPEPERRLRFARWVASPSNALASRVIVNRVWQHHFGRGLASSPNDLGKMGEPPTHPELLDWLARWFVDPARGNGSLKRLHRLLMTTEAFARSSVTVVGDEASLPAGLDPATLLGWFPARRLEAEAVRDAMLAASGELVRDMEGPGFRAFEHRGGGGQNEYFAADLAGSPYARRTVYRTCVHSARDPMLDGLDCPEFSTRTPVRASTTTPLQALSLMNGTFVQRQAERAAARAAAVEPGSLERQVRWLWLQALGREPGGPEAARSVALAREAGLADVAWALLNSNEFVQLR
ncbi:MAG: DUF1553 domain-containing protein [Verrucomicrobiota bacterium]